MKTLAQSKESVFAFLKSIPKGKVVTYAIVARCCGLKNPRNVGWILSQNKNPDAIPCYRVVRSNGTLALGYVFGGVPEQKRRLKADGIMFSNRNSILRFEAVLFRG